MSEQLHDARRTYTFYMDDAVLDVFGPRIGAYGVAVYALLARHAKNKEAFPSYKRMTATLGVSRQTITRTLTRLIREGLVTRTKRTHREGDPDTNLYTLMDLSEHHAQRPGTHESGTSPQDGGRSSWDVPPSPQDGGVRPHRTEGTSPGRPEGISLKGSQGKEKDSPISIVSFPSPAEQVRDHLCAVTGRLYRSLGEIPGCLTRGATLEQCTLVVDWWKAVKTTENPDQEQYFDHTTPFRAKNFDKYLAQAEVWQEQGRPPPLRTQLSEQAQRTAQASLRLLEEYRNGPDRHAGVPRRAQ